MAHDFPEISEADGGFTPEGGCPAHAPAHLNAAAVTNGFAPRPLDPGFAWADFAPGDGLDAALHAAANPGGRFFAPASGRAAAAWRGSSKISRSTATCRRSISRSATAASPRGATPSAPSASVASPPPSSPAEFSCSAITRSPVSRR